MKFLRQIKINGIVRRSTNRIEDDEKQFSKTLSETQINFFENDTKTQDLLRKYISVINGESEASLMLDIINQTRGKESQWLYLRHKINESLMESLKLKPIGGRERE